jgi:pantothenate synthetase
VTKLTEFSSKNESTPTEYYVHVVFVPVGTGALHHQHISLFKKSTQHCLLRDDAS